MKVQIICGKKKKKKKEPIASTLIEEDIENATAMVLLYNSGML